jgi:DNA-binding IclR family transcriptional regulator
MDTETVEEKGGRRRGIQSVEIGLRLLQSVSALGVPSSLSAISQACGMAAPQAHRYLQSLIATGMARQDPGTGRYDLGPAAIKLGLAALARTDAFKLVDGLVSDFALRTGQTVQIAALGPLGPTIVRWYAGAPGVTTSLSVGSVLSLVHSATGRTFLSFSSKAETADLVAKELRRSPMTRTELDVLCAEIRAAGRAHVSGTVIPGLFATAFPIFDLQGRPALTATLLWPDGYTDPGQAAAVEELAEICRQISIGLGWSPPAS